MQLASRRAVLSFAVAVVAALPAQAADGPAAALIEKASTEVIALIKAKTGRAREEGIRSILVTYFDLPFMGFTLDGKPDDGLLPTDRPHFAKVAATYRFEWFGSKTNATDFNLFYLIGSGTPVTTRARYGVVSGMIVSKRGDLGRTDTLSQTDLSLTHKYRFGRDLRFGFAFDVADDVVQVVHHLSPDASFG